MVSGAVPPGLFVVAAAVVAGGLGAQAGAGARWLLARMRRGARVRAPVCEVAVGVLWALVGGAWAAGVVPGGWVPALLGLGWLAAAAGVVDLRHRRLPDALTLPALPVALVLLAPLGLGPVVRGAIGAVAAVAVHAAVHLVVPRAMGAGDVKLAGPLGAVLTASSWSAPVLALVLAALLTGAGAVAGMVRGRVGRGGAVPHGPSMLVACSVVATAAAVGAGTG